MKRIIFLILYYKVAYYLPNSYSPIFGKISNKFRVFCVKRIFKKSGKISTINRLVSFGGGKNVIIGDNSGIGERATIPNDIIIGNNVIISRDVFILNRNHNYYDIKAPIITQGYLPSKVTIIEDDCWIGLRSIINAGRTIKQGSIIAMGTVLTKDFPEYSIIGGNPGRLIKSRKELNG